MTELKTIKLPDNIVLTESLIYKSLDGSVIHEHFSITDLPNQMIGVCAELPAATAVFDLSDSSLSIRNNGSRQYAADSQDLFRQLTDIIYQHEGIVEKFPGDGISMHFPNRKNNSVESIKRAFRAIIAMDNYLRDEKKLNRKKFRFTLTYGDDTVITKFGNSKHEELISIGHAVNVAHKIEKLVKEEQCFIGMDEISKRAIMKTWNLNLHQTHMPNDLRRNPNMKEYWYGVKY
jgi:hypothetical protein